MEVRLCNVIGFLSENRTVGEGSGDEGTLVLGREVGWGIGTGEQGTVAEDLVYDGRVLAEFVSFFEYAWLVIACGGAKSSSSDSVESLTLAW